MFLCIYWILKTRIYRKVLNLTHFLQWVFHWLSIRIFVKLYMLSMLNCGMNMLNCMFLSWLHIIHHGHPENFWASNHIFKIVYNISGLLSLFLLLYWPYTYLCCVSVNIGQLFPLVVFCYFLFVLLCSARHHFLIAMNWR